MLSGIVFALLTSGGALPTVQEGATPGQYLAGHKWDEKSKGALLYLPNRQLQVADNPQIDGGFRTFACGSLHVVAPTQLTIIDPDYKQPPNVYDGLPRKLKVMYLASTFSKSQWKTACTTGIGFASLNNEQQAVYRSILPSEFKYETSAVRKSADDNSNQGAPTQTTLTHDEESQVLLKIYKELTLGVRLGGGGFSAISAQEWDRHRPGTKVSRRIDNAVEDKNSAFGVEVRKSMPNATKPSDLDYKNSAYNPMLTLTPSSSVNEICKSASALVHRTILPDARFGEEKVATLGASARCGDVLKALALCFTGTFRKVGDTFVLTSDLEGIGTKMTKLAYWNWNLKQRAEAESDKWKGLIAASSGFRSIEYAADDPLTPNDAMRKFMDSDTGQGDKTMPASALTPVLLQMLNSKDNHFGEPLRTDVAEPWDSVFWSFVPPGGDVLNWEDELCDMNDFSRYAENHAPRTQAQEPSRIGLDTLPGSALIYQTEDPEFATKLPQLAKNQGFTELWIQTTQARTLSAVADAAKAVGIPVKLVVEPFTAIGEQPKNQLDRTILGTSYSESQKLIDGSEWVESSNRTYSSNQRFVDFIGQKSLNLGGQWKLLSGLANSPNLAGTVILAGTPDGYEQKSDWAEYEPPQMAAPLSLGYTTDLRERFLLANSVDPVDLLEVRDQFDLDPLEQSISSFGELNSYLYGKVAETPPSLRDKWDKARSAANEERLKQFEALFAAPPMVEWRRKLHDTSLNWDSVASPLVDGPVATMDDDPYGKQLPANAYYLQAVGYPLSDGAALHLRRHFANRIKKQSTPFAIDLRAAPADQLADVLKLVFTSKPPK